MTPFSFADMADQPIPGSDNSTSAALPPVHNSATLPPKHLTLTGRGSGFSCPNCSTETQYADALGVLVIACPNCLGFLSQGKDFRMIVDTARQAYRGEEIASPLDRLQLQVTRTCPTCQKPFETGPYAGPGTTVLDSCSDCGTVWLDDEELARIQRAPGRR
jgi:Zn-finger nucleic acid-binding protein